VEWWGSYPFTKAAGRELLSATNLSPLDFVRPLGNWHNTGGHNMSFDVSTPVESKCDTRWAFVALNAFTLQLVIVDTCKHMHFSKLIDSYTVW